MKALLAITAAGNGSIMTVSKMGPSLVQISPKGVCQVKVDSQIRHTTSSPLPRRRDSCVCLRMLNARVCAKMRISNYKTLKKNSFHSNYLSEQKKKILSRVKTSASLFHLYFSATLSGSCSYKGERRLGLCGVRSQGDQAHTSTHTNTPSPWRNSTDFCWDF